MKKRQERGPNVGTCKTAITRVHDGNPNSNTDGANNNGISEPIPVGSPDLVIDSMVKGALDRLPVGVAGVLDRLHKQHHAPWQPEEKGPVTTNVQDEEAKPPVMVGTRERWGRQVLGLRGWCLSL